MPPKRSFDAELAVLENARGLSAEAAEPLLTKALGHKNNYLVAKAATLTEHHRLTGLTGQLAEAFPRFFGDYKLDPQCWAKNAIAKTLAAFEYQEAELFLTGLRHKQLEPVWGGNEDTAGPLRGTCALALVQCRGLTNHQVLVYLTPLFTDKEVPVQVNGARAIEQVGTPSAALLLRLRAELGSGEPELLGACYSGVLSLEGASALGWAAQFLVLEDDAAAEAAMAIAETHAVEAFEILRAAHGRAKDPWFRSAVLSAIALTRQQVATEWLLEMIAKDALYASEAHEALCRSAPSSETLARLKDLGKPCG